MGIRSDSLSRTPQRRRFADRALRRSPKIAQPSSRCSSSAAVFVRSRAMFRRIFRQPIIPRSTLSELAFERRMLAREPTGVHARNRHRQTRRDAGLE